MQTSIYFLCITILYTFRTTYAIDAFDYVYRFIDAKATSTNPGSFPNEFNPRHAIQAVMGYWCSEGNHDPDTVVTWIGTLNFRIPLNGLQIRWAYSPKEVKVAVVNEDLIERTALDWRATPSTEPSFDETIYFPKPVWGNVVKIFMRGSSKSFYGITMVTPLTHSKPIVQIVSGITSPLGEMCLQVLHGLTYIDNTPIVLDFCSAAIAAGDGRELWQLNQKNQLQNVASSPPKCLVNQEMTTEGGRIVLSDCSEAIQTGDGRSSWEFVPYGQIVLNAKNSTMCLSQKGQSAGFRNLVNSRSSKASASSTADESHDALKGIDGNPTTYWASNAFIDSGVHNVLYNIDLGSPTVIDNIRIDWEYPAFEFSIQVSDSSMEWKTIEKNAANPSNVTLHMGTTDKVQNVRVVLIKPHITYGLVNGKFVYGIRDISIFINKLETIVENRYKAGNSKDARDKYYLDPVQEFDKHLSGLLTSAEADLQSHVQSTQLSMEAAESILLSLDQCSSKIKNIEETFELVDTKFSNITQQATNSLFIEKKCGSTKCTRRAPLGKTEEFPGEDCYRIKQSDTKASSGFYWLIPRCSPKPFRAWCDMTTGVMFYIITQKEQNLFSSMTQSPESLQLTCAQHGLQPLSIQSHLQLETLVTVLIKIGFDFSTNFTIPLAYDASCFTSECSNIFRDLVLGNDITSLFFSSALRTEEGTVSQGYNTAGLSKKQISFFNFEEATIGAIVCSTNTLLTDTNADSVPIECDTVAHHNPLFNKPLDTNFILRCPSGCKEDVTLNVFGSHYVYHETSSICRAALHAGVLQNGGDFNVALEGPREEYLGVFANGVESRALSNPNQGRSFRVGPIPITCPIDLLVPDFVESHASFLQLSLSNKSKAYNPKNSNFSFQQTSLRDVSFNGPEEMNTLLSQIYQTIDTLYGVDPHLLKVIRQETSETLGKTRGALKPLERILEKREPSVLYLYEMVQKSGDSLYKNMGQSYATLQDTSKKLDSVSIKYHKAHAQKDWELCTTSSHLFEEAWEVPTTLETTRQSDWKYVPLTENVTLQEANTKHCPLSIVQNGILMRQESSSNLEPVVLLKDHTFYDFIFTTRFRVASSSSNQSPIVGVVFRAKDFQNMYIIELDSTQFPGTKRLIRVEKGVRTLLSEKKNGGFIPNAWHFIHIETSHSRIRVCMQNTNQALIQVFDYQDEHHLSGTIGLYSQNTASDTTVQFTQLFVQNKKCKMVAFSHVLPPAPLTCGILKDSYFPQFSSFHTIKDAPTSSASVSFWSYSQNKNGRPRVILQKNPISSEPGEGAPGSIAFLGTHHTCAHGQFQFDYFLPCKEGSAGAVFRYRDDNFYSLVEVTPSLKVIYRIKDGSSFQQIKPFQENVYETMNTTVPQWLQLTVTFNGPFVSALIKPATSTKSSEPAMMGKKLTYRINPQHIPFHESLSRKTLYRVGLATSKCSAIMFDQIKAGPIDLFRPPSSFLPDRSIDQRVLPSFGSVCSTSQSFIERQSLCLKLFMPDGEATGQCLQNFCSRCCSYYTTVKSLSHQQNCFHQCSQNDIFARETKKAWQATLSLCLKPSFLNKTPADSTTQRKECVNCCLNSSLLQHASLLRPKLNLLESNKQNTSNTFFPSDSMEMLHCKESCEIKYQFKEE